MELIFENYKNDKELINFTINNKEINGILGKDYKELINIIKVTNNFSGKIFVNSDELKKDDVNNYRKKIGIVEEQYIIPQFIENVYELMLYEIRRKNISLKNSEKKIYDSLIIVGLDPVYLNRKLKSLSTSEIKIIQLAICLISNPNLIIVEDIFKYLDKIWEKRIIMLLQKIKEQYHKTIIIASPSSEEIYKYTTNLIIYKNKKILANGNTYEIMQRVDFLKKNRISIPKIVEFTYLAKKNKKVKIDYHKDVRDIIKDIYKHV